METPRRSDGTPAADDAPGRVLLGRYRIERVLGQGGMGEVLLAHDTLLDRRVALKRLRPDGADPVGGRRAILKEARRVSRINDPRIAAIHDVLDGEDGVVLVMEYVDGETLRQRMTRPMPIEDFWAIALPCVEGIEVAHAHGLVHRDLKPENLMITRGGQVKILDFGVARRVAGANDPSTTLTTTVNSIAGTPGYMAPEAHLGGDIDARTDIFSLGVVFYEMLTAEAPFAGPTYGAILDKILNETPPPVSERNAAVDPALARVVSTMLAKLPSERHPSAAELRRHLAAARAGLEPPPLPAAPPPAESATTATPVALDAPLPPTRRRPAAVAVGVPVAGLAVIAWLVLRPLALPPDRHVAVLPPETPGAQPDFAAFALGATELVAAGLRRHADVPGVQIASFQDGYEEHVRSAGDARKELGATLALATTFTQDAGALHARLRLEGTGSGGVLASREVRTAVAEPFVFLEQVQRAARELIGLPSTGRGPPGSTGVQGPGTLRFLLQGLGRVRSATTAEEAARAVQDLESACRIEPEAAVARAGLAAAELKAGNVTGDSAWLVRAEASARAAARLGPDRPEAQRILGLTLARRGRHAEALEAFERAVTLLPTDDDLCLRLARAHARLGRRDREREVYLAASRRRPHDWVPWWWLSSWSFREGRFDEARVACEAMIARAPDLHRGYSSLGGALVLRGDYARAIEVLEHSIALRPTRFAYDNLGTACFNSGRIADAIAAYNQSFQFGDADHENWLNLGDAYFWLRNRGDQAQGAYAQAVRLGREEMADRANRGASFDVTIPAHLASVFPKLGEPDSARVYLARALAVDSANVEVAYSAALTCWQLNDRGRAVAWLEKAVRGGYPTVWLRDSPVFQEWRVEPRYRALVAGAPRAARDTSPGRGG